MTIESAPVGQAAAKPAQAEGRKSGKASGTPSESAGFMALLSAADDALDVSVNASSQTASLEDPSTDALDTLNADASALAGWVLGMPVPAAQEDVAIAAGAKRQGASVVASEAGAGQANALQGATRKTGKANTTAELQQAKPTASASVPALQGLEAPDTKHVDPKVVVAQEVAIAPRTEVKEPAPLATQVALGERPRLESVAGKSLATEVTYFQPQASSAPMGMDGVVASQSASPLEAYVAEQVTYWISQDVHNAELTLDGMGASTVEVSISMQGNEAQVAFRTDEVQARDALEGASQHLKELLFSQGVTLTGMSVGTSLSGGASDGQGRRQRQDGQQATVTVIAPLSQEGFKPTRVPQGQALDLFV